jgi:hypothetical protein
VYGLGFRVQDLGFRIRFRRSVEPGGKRLWLPPVKDGPLAPAERQPHQSRLLRVALHLSNLPLADPLTQKRGRVDDVLRLVWVLERAQGWVQLGI